MNGINWNVLYKDGTEIRQIQQNGKYNFFGNINKQNIMFFNVQNIYNNTTYSINLENGQFLIGGIPLFFSIQNDFRHQNIIGNSKLKLFWYNDCDIEIGSTEPKISKVYFGYKIPLNLDYNINGVKGTIVQQKILAGIDVKTSKFSISQSKKIKTIIDNQQKFILV